MLLYHLAWRGGCLELFKTWRLVYAAAIGFKETAMVPGNFGLTVRRGNVVINKPKKENQIKRKLSRRYNFWRRQIFNTLLN